VLLPRHAEAPHICPCCAPQKDQGPDGEHLKTPRTCDRGNELRASCMIAGRFTQVTSLPQSAREAMRDGVDVPRCYRGFSRTEPRSMHILESKLDVFDRTIIRRGLHGPYQINNRIIRRSPSTSSKYPILCLPWSCSPQNPFPRDSEKPGSHRPARASLGSRLRPTADRSPGRFRAGTSSHLSS
jgi:hypothetical protein